VQVWNGGAGDASAPGLSIDLIGRQLKRNRHPRAGAPATSKRPPFARFSSVAIDFASASPGAPPTASRHRARAFGSKPRPLTKPTPSASIRSHGIGDVFLSAPSPVVSSR
jgi:hypothetical protein